ILLLRIFLIKYIGGKDITKQPKPDQLQIIFPKTPGKKFFQIYVLWKTIDYYLVNLEPRNLILPNFVEHSSHRETRFGNYLGSPNP
ncbi:MAG: hypothetical protein KC643_05560, partial [Nitrospira sp.]|nr:hypothetical protein [Nitrospira sp.]MCA9480605.1 hypothetical protein [Nitrospira sp.]